MCWSFCGSMAMSPIDSEGSLSVFGCQALRFGGVTLAVKSEVFQTPPLTDAAYPPSAFVGSTRNRSTAPVAGKPCVGVRPGMVCQTMTLGPFGIQSASERPSFCVLSTTLGASSFLASQPKLAIPQPKTAAARSPKLIHSRRRTLLDPILPSDFPAKAHTRASAAVTFAQRLGSVMSAFCLRRPHTGAATSLTLTKKRSSSVHRSRGSAGAYRHGKRQVPEVFSQDAQSQ